MAKYRFNIISGIILILIGLVGVTSAIIINPTFATNHLSPDHNLTPSTLTSLLISRLGSFLIGSLLIIGGYALMRVRKFRISDKNIMDFIYFKILDIDGFKRAGMEIRNYLKLAVSKIVKIKEMNLQRFIWILLLHFSIVLFAFSVYRASTYPFVHDESLSFAIFNWAPQWGGTANNHLLNTVLMRWCSTLFGNSELSLRLPNLLAHALYLICSLLLLKRIKNVVLQLAGFFIINLNPFLLDFFFLARGYGLALAFLMLSLLLIIRAIEEKRQNGHVKFVILSSLVGFLTILANFSFLNYYLPLLLVSAWLLLSDSSLKRFSPSHIRATIILFFTLGISLVLVINKIFHLQNSGEFYDGGHENFLVDTIGSLVHSSLYSIQLSSTVEMIIVIILIGLLIGCIVLGVFQLFKKEVSLFMVLLLILGLTIFLPIVQHWIVNTLYPTGRAALYYLPLFALLVIFAFQVLLQKSSRRWVKGLVVLIPSIIAVLLCWHFYRSFKFDYCYLWAYDRHNDQILEIINQDRETHFPDQIVNIGNTWLMEPSLNFYRITRNYTWLAPATRNPISLIDNDYLYAFESDLEKIARDDYIILASFPDTQTILVRVDQTH